MSAPPISVARYTRAKFNAYRFADNKEDMITLLARVVTVSLETVTIPGPMKALARNSD